MMVLPTFGGQDPNLNRVGLAVHEEAQAKQPHDRNDLTRILGQLEQTLRDLRKGVRTRWNWCDLLTIDTNAIPATGNGVALDAMTITGGSPFDSLTIDSVGGAGATMQISINGSKFFRVDAGDVFDDGEIWRATIRVTTAGAGTANVFLTAYVPGVGGRRGL